MNAANSGWHRDSVLAWPAPVPSRTAGSVWPIQNMAPWMWWRPMSNRVTAAATSLTASNVCLEDDSTKVMPCDCLFSVPFMVGSWYLCKLIHTARPLLWATSPKAWEGCGGQACSDQMYSILWTLHCCGNKLIKAKSLKNFNVSWFRNPDQESWIRIPERRKKDQTQRIARGSKSGNMSVCKQNLSRNRIQITTNWHSGWLNSDSAHPSIYIGFVSDFERISLPR